MKAIHFPGVNVVLGENQPEYTPLPVMHMQDPQGTVVMCYELTDEEALQIATSKKMYIQCLTFGNKFQPILPMADLGDQIELKSE